MKIELLLIALLLSFSINAQEVQPYIIKKDGTKLEYNYIKIKQGKVLVRNTTSEQYQKFKKKALNSVVGGYKGEYSRLSHSQVIYRKMKLKKGEGLKGVGTVEEGKSPLKVVMSNGSDMILAANAYSPTTPAQPSSYGGGTTLVGGSSGVMVYYVQGNDFKILRFDWMKEELFNDMKASFGSDCPCSNDIITEFASKKGKLLRIQGFLDKLKDCYFENCLTEL